MKKVLAVLLLIPFLFILPASCRGSGSNRPVVITLLLLGNKPTNDRADAAIAEINKITAERIGAVLRTRYIEWADWQTRYQLAIASGDPSIDLVISSTTWLYGWEIVRRGGFYPLTPELLQENAPKTWAAVPPEHWDLVTDDGFIWFIPENQFSQFTNHGMYWRKDWAQMAGIEDIEKFEDLELYWDAVKDHFPGVFPWDVSGSGIATSLFNGFFLGKTHTQPIIGVSVGNYNIFEYRIDDPYTVVSNIMESDYLIEAARLFDRWGKKGYWRDDVLNYQGETRNLLLAGLSGSDQHHTNTFITLREQMDRDQPGSELQMYYWGKETGNVNRDLITHGAMSVNAGSRNVENALQMYDLLRNDKQIYLLFNYGIEGVDYLVNPDGTFSRPEGYNEITDILGTNFWGGRIDEFEPVWDTWWSGRIDFVAHKNSIARDYPLARFAFESGNVSAEMAAMGDVCVTHLPAIHFGRTNDPERAVADFRAAMRRAGYDRVKAEIQSQLNVLKAKSE